MADNLPARPVDYAVVDNDNYRVTVSFNVEAEPGSLRHGLLAVGRAKDAVREAI